MKRFESLNIANDNQDAKGHPSNQIRCDECFRRESDKKQHKYISKQQKPVNKQHGISSME